jgi:hypothetical protein
MAKMSVGICYRLIHSIQQAENFPNPQKERFLLKKLLKINALQKVLHAVPTA